MATPHASIARYSQQNWQRRKVAVSLLAEVGSAEVLSRLRDRMESNSSSRSWSKYHGAKEATDAAASAEEFGHRRGWSRSAYMVDGTDEMSVATRLGLFLDVSVYSPTLDEVGGEGSFVDKTDLFPPESMYGATHSPAAATVELYPAKQSTKPHAANGHRGPGGDGGEVLMKGPLYIRLSTNTAAGPVWKWQKRWFAVVGHYLRFASSEMDLEATMHLPVRHNNKMTQQDEDALHDSTGHAPPTAMSTLYNAVDLRGLLLPTGGSDDAPGGRFFAKSSGGQDGMEEGHSYRPFFASENRLSLRFVLPTDVPADIPANARGATRFAGLMERASVLVLQAPTEGDANSWDLALQKVASGVYKTDTGERSHPYATRSDYDPHSLPVFVAVAVLPNRHGIVDGTKADGHDKRIKFAYGSSHLYATHTHTPTDSSGAGGPAMAWDPLLSKHVPGEGSRAEGAFMGFRSYLFTDEQPTLAQQQGWRTEYVRFTGDYSVDCITTDWSRWAACGASCGGSTQRRSRSVLQVTCSVMGIVLCV
jgi:hypothetical protein